VEREDIQLRVVGDFSKNLLTYGDMAYSRKNMRRLNRRIGVTGTLYKSHSAKRRGDRSFLKAFLLGNRP